MKCDWWKRKIFSYGTFNYPVKLRVIYNRDFIDYQTVYDLTEEEYEKLSAKRVSDELQLIRDSLKVRGQSRMLP